MSLPGGDAVDDVLAGFDVGHLTTDERDELTTLLRHYEVQHTFLGSELQAPAAESELIEDLVAYVRRGTDETTGPPSPLGRTGEPPPSPLEAAVAPRWRRLVAFLVEGYLFAAIAFGIGALTSGAIQSVVWITLGIASGLVLVALTGRTLGMWIFSMRVVMPPRTGPPGWITAAVRFLVATAPGYVALALAPFLPEAVVRWFGLVDLVWMFVCFGPILFDPYRRGLHDRVARTVVIDADWAGTLD